jgi:hypothetical protein
VHSLRDFGLGEGGLLHRIESACHVTKIFGQIVFVFVLTWVPMMALGLAQEGLRGTREPLLHDPLIHVRFLIAAPLLVMADHVFPWIVRRSLRQLVAQGSVPDEAMPRFESLHEKARRLADASWPEIVLIVIAIGLGVTELIGLVPISGRRYQVDRTATQLWHSLVAGPLLQFLLWRSLWRWLLWARIVIGLSRIPLRLVALHPDRCGGLAFLKLPSIGYCAILLFVVSSLLCAGWGGHFPVEPSLISFKPYLATFAIIGGAIAFGPLFFLTPQLVRARLDGLLENDILAAEEGSRFRRAWVIERGPDFLASQDAQTLDSLGNLYRQSVERIRGIIFDKRDVVVLLLAALLPVLPLMVMHVPAESWRELFELLTGSPLR